MWDRRPALDSSLTHGRVFGSYQLQTQLGEGGMGIVFRAVRMEDGEVVAVKILRRELAGDETFRRRFFHEARAAGRVQHRNVVPVIEAGENEGRPYLVVQYVEGGSLAERIESRGPLPVDEAARIVGQLAGGLDVLHEHEIIHRDIKSSNVLLDQEGMALLTDFGLAKGRADTVLTRPGQVMGTLDYLAPELIRGERASASSDVYALGCLLYECLAGGPPFAGQSPLQVGIYHLEYPPPDLTDVRSDLPKSLSWAVLQALEKDPQKRPQTATAYARLVAAAARSSRGD